MNIKDLPPELLIYILSFVDQIELMSSVQHVCNHFKDMSLSPLLWEKMSIREWRRFYDLDHLYLVQHNVKDLEISGLMLVEVFQYRKQIKLNNVRSLQICEDMPIEMWVIFIHDKFVKMFPNLKNLSINLQYPLVIDECIHALTKFDLKSFSIDYDTEVVDYDYEMDPDVGRVEHDAEFVKHDAEIVVDSAIMSLIHTHTNLQCIKLGTNIYLSNDKIAEIINEYPKITTLELGRTDHISNRVFTSCTSPIKLTNFTVGSKYFNDEGLEGLMQRSSCPLNLDIQKCRNITNEGLQNLVYGKVLQQLTISFHDEIIGSCTCNQTLTMIGLGCCRLRYFSASGCRHIDSSGVLEIVRSCKDLQELHLKQCLNVTDEMILLIGNCKKLKGLFIDGLFDISLNSVISLLKSCRYMGIEMYLEGNFQYMTSNKPSLHNFQHIATRKMCVPATDTSHCHVKYMELLCNRDVTKENVLKLLDLCTDLRYLRLKSKSMTQIDDVVLSELLGKCFFLTRSRVYDDGFVLS